jgi:flagellar motor switch protein FliM
MPDAHIHHPGESGGRQPWLRPVDFAAPSALPPDQPARIRRLIDEFGPIVTPRATAELGLPLQLQPLWLRELPWRESQPVPADDAVTTVIGASGGGQLYLILDPTLATLIVERLLGTEPDPARPLRPVTTIDRALLSRVHELLIHALNRLWEEATGTVLTAGSVAPMVALAAEHEPTEPTLLMAIEVKLFGTYTVMHLLFPQSVIIPVAARLSKPSPRGETEDPEVAHAVQARLGEANVDVQVKLGSVRLTAGEIADLHPGDRIPLPTLATEPAALIVDGVPVQFGHIGRSGSRRAVRVGGSLA